MDNEIVRNKWIMQVLESIPSGARLLDAGAGEQQFRKYCTHLKYVSQDFAEYDGAGDGSGLQTGKWDYRNIDIVSDITSIPEPSSSFDVVLCTEVFEHLPEPILAIKEFYRLLKRGGRLIITAPFCSLTHFAPYHYYSGFNRYFYEKNLHDNGFLIDVINPNGNYFKYLAQEVHRIEGVSLLYSQYRTRWFERFALFIVLKMLGKMSKRDNGSNELLHFGYHIVAIKQ